MDETTYQAFVATKHLIDNLHARVQLMRRVIGQPEPSAITIEMAEAMQGLMGEYWPEVKRLEQLLDHS